MPSEPQQNTPSTHTSASKSATQNIPSVESTIQLCTTVLEDLKAEDIVSIDLRQKANFAETLMIATGNSNRHVNSLVEHIKESAKAQGHYIIGVEASGSDGWSLIDLDAVVVHVMTQEMRDFYQIERLWQTEFDAMAANAHEAEE